MNRNIILLSLVLLLLLVITSITNNVEPFSVTEGIKGGFQGFIDGFTGNKKRDSDRNKRNRKDKKDKKSKKKKGLLKGLTTNIRNGIKRLTSFLI